MLDPKEIAKGGFGAFAAKYRERWAARMEAKANGDKPAASAPDAPPTVPADQTLPQPGEQP
jgi:hypothetical protein